MSPGAALDEVAAESCRRFGEQAGNEPIADELLAAAQALHAAALPLEADWTSQLQAALDALAACGVIARGSPA